MNFADALKHDNNFTATENGAVALKSTNSYLLDFFSTAGNYRDNIEDGTTKFIKAFCEDNLLAMKMLFYTRDVRGGLGERKICRDIYRYLANNYPTILEKNMWLIPYYGRFDDLYSLVGTPLENEMFQFMKQVISTDCLNCKEGLPVTCAGKWLKSINTSSKESRELGRKTARHFGISDKEYRQMLSHLRKKLDVVERKMSAQDWKNIKYSAVPSRAMMIYRKAFVEHDQNRFSAYLENVKKCNEKINAGTLYPYDIVEKILYEHENNDVLEEQWKALPNYIEGEQNILVMADVSGSMRGRPMATSIGLAIYFAERNKGTYHNMFMTFSSIPEIQTIVGNSLYEKVRVLKKARWSMNTDFEKALDLILDVAIENNAKQEELPKSLIVVSDMQFDEARIDYSHKVTFMEKMKQKYARCGYNMPNIVFWNVNEAKDSYVAYKDSQDIQLVSGQSVTTFKSIVQNIGKTPYEAMLNVLNDERYENVVI